MATCDICGKDDLKSEKGLLAHVRFKHSQMDQPEVDQQEVIQSVVQPVAEWSVVEPKGPKVNGNMSTGGLNRPGKMVKMIQARCRVCNPRGQGKRGWWETCPHDPYFHVQPKPGANEFQELADGTIIKLDKPRVEYEKVANWRQVPEDHGITSGRSVKIQRERGSKFPNELGFAPICDYRNCWETNPQIHANRVVTIEGASVRVGDYHTREEAAMMTLRFNQTPVYVGLDRDIENRRAQLDAVQVL